MTKPTWSRLMRRPEACAYVSMTVAEFEKAVAARALPIPRIIGTVERWDRVEIDRYLDGEESDWRRGHPLYAA